MKDRNNDGFFASDESFDDVNNEKVTGEKQPEISEENRNDNLSGSESEEKWQEKYNELNNSYLRLVAEFDNYRKRTLKEKTELLKTAGEKVLIDVLPVLDDFERALDNISSSDNVEAVKEGVQLIYDKFVDFLLRSGVKKMDVIGEPFDLDKHEALTTVPAEKEEMKDRVVDSIQHGYTLGDKVIRYPKVIVAK